MRKTTESWKAIANYYMELARSYFRAHPRASEDKFLAREFPKLYEHLKSKHWTDNDIYGVWLYSMDAIRSGIRAARKSIAIVMTGLGTRTARHFKKTPKASFKQYLDMEYVRFEREKTEDGWTEGEITRTWIDAIPVMEKAREDSGRSRRPWKAKQFIFRKRGGKIGGAWK